MEGKDKEATQNGDTHNKSPMKQSTAKFEDETVAQSLEFVSQKIATHDSRGQSGDTAGVLVMPELKHVRGSSLDENDLGRQFRSSLPDSSPRVNAMSSRSPNPARTPTRVTGKGVLPLSASPFWERIVSTSGNQGASSLTPARRQPRAIICGEASPDNIPTVPKFGDWDDSNPSASQGFTQVFDQVRVQRQNGGGTRTASANGPSSQSRQKTFTSSEGCCCFRWLKH